jgi:ketosteroid isomerase-like protein
MKRFLAVSLVAFLCVTKALAAPPPMAQTVADTIATFVNEVNKGQATEALARFTSDVSITEDLAPFSWRGANAGAEWLSAMQANGARIGVTDIQMKLGVPLQVLVDGDRAYEAVPGVVTLKGKAGAVHETGVLTFALRREGGAWKIATLAWGGAAAAP